MLRSLSDELEASGAVRGEVDSDPPSQNRESHIPRWRGGFGPYPSEPRGLELCSLESRPCDTCCELSCVSASGCMQHQHATALRTSGSENGASGSGLALAPGLGGDGERSLSGTESLARRAAGTRPQCS